MTLHWHCGYDTVCAQLDKLMDDCETRLKGVYDAAVDVCKIDLRNLKRLQRRKAKKT